MIQIIVSCLRNTFSYIFFASFSYLTHCVRNKGMSFQARRGFARLQCMLYLCKENFSQKRWFGAGKDWKCSSKHYWSLESLFFFLCYRIVDAVFNQTAIKIIRHVHSNQNWRKLRHHSVGLKSVYWRDCDCECVWTLVFDWTGRPKLLQDFPLSEHKIWAIRLSLTIRWFQNELK